MSERDEIEFYLNEISKLKEELIASKEQAERSSRAKSEFLSRMSHELLTPMNAIMGMMQIAAKKDSLDDVRYYLEEIGDASRHMVRMIKNVLDVSGRGNTITFEDKEFKFNSMLEYVLGRIVPETEKKQQTFDIEISGSVPKSLVGDEKRIAQVMIHLLTNASKFTPDNGDIRLYVNKADENDEGITLKIIVTDNGIGIDEEHQKVLFDIFEQIDGGLARKKGGVGVGLALSKLIVEMMGGQIWIESALGEGTKASFTCKVKKGEDTQ